MKACRKSLVTARYREENLQTTPLAITALSVNALEERSLTNVDDIGLAIPNAFMRPPVSNYGPTETIGLRGIIRNRLQLRVRARCRASTSTTSTTARSPAPRWICSTSTAWRCCAVRRARCSARTASAARSASSPRSRRVTTRAASRSPTDSTTASTSPGAVGDFALVQDKAVHACGGLLPPARWLGQAPRLHLRDEAAGHAAARAASAMALARTAPRAARSTASPTSSPPAARRITTSRSRQAVDPQQRQRLRARQAGRRVLERGARDVPLPAERPARVQRGR